MNPNLEHPLSQLALSMDGKMVATASSRGTLLRVFDTDTGSLLHVSLSQLFLSSYSKNCFVKEHSRLLNGAAGRTCIRACSTPAGRQAGPVSFLRKALASKNPCCSGVRRMAKVFRRQYRELLWLAERTREGRREGLGHPVGSIVFSRENLTVFPRLCFSRTPSSSRSCFFSAHRFDLTSQVLVSPPRATAGNRSCPLFQIHSFFFFFFPFFHARDDAR